MSSSSSKIHCPQCFDRKGIRPATNWEKRRNLCTSLRSGLHRRHPSSSLAATKSRTVRHSGTGSARLSWKLATKWRERVFVVKETFMDSVTLLAWYAAAFISCSRPSSTRSCATVTWASIVSVNNRQTETVTHTHTDTHIQRTTANNVLTPLCQR